MITATIVNSIRWVRSRRCWPPCATGGAFLRFATAAWIIPQPPAEGQPQAVWCRRAEGDPRAKSGL